MTDLKPYNLKRRTFRQIVAATVILEKELSDAGVELMLLWLRAQGRVVYANKLEREFVRKGERNV